LGGPIWGKWDGEATADLCDLLQKGLSKKEHRLREENIAVPKILLFLDEYGYSDSNMYGRCLPQISELDFFHTVFVVQGNHRGFVFHSEDSDWQKQQFAVLSLHD
jgi:hypothetical protein